MKTYLFDVGNSTTGPIGFCARVKAWTPEEALTTLKEELPEQFSCATSSRIEYIIVYTNAEALTVSDIAESEEE